MRMLCSKDYQVGKFRVVIYGDGNSFFFYKHYHIAAYNSFRSEWYFIDSEVCDMSKEDADVASGLRDLFQK